MALVEDVFLPTNLTSSNLSSCNVHNHLFSTKVTFSLFYIILLVFGACGNVLALCITFQRRKKKLNSTDLYLVNLALSDALFTLALPGRIAYYILESDWPFGDWFCRITAFIFYMNTYVSIYFMTCVSVDRYVAVVRTRHPGRIRKMSRARGICVLIWSLVFLQTQAFKMSLQVTVAFMNLNCCIDPIIYFFAFRGYKRRLLRIFRNSGSLATSSTAKTTPSESNSNSQPPGSVSVSV
uniref:G-protein coupled receptors family 1 profile domain-containing protein n=1 Tax=Cyanoderma ruficeps TaxID=181631 RepID=A0A8C3R395_9PASS